MDQKNGSKLVARDDFTASMSRQLSKNADIFRSVVCTAHVDTVLDEADRAVAEQEHRAAGVHAAEAELTKAKIFRIKQPRICVAGWCQGSGRLGNLDFGVQFRNHTRQTLRAAHTGQRRTEPESSGPAIEDLVRVVDESGCFTHDDRIGCAVRNLADWNALAATKNTVDIDRRIVPLTRGTAIPIVPDILCTSNTSI